jgi:hypothetical protein
MEQEQWSRRDFLAAAGAAGLAAWAVRPIAAAAASNYEEKVLAKKPVAYWRLGEAKGPGAVDRTGNGHKGTYKGTPAFRERGAIKGDTAVKLDGKRSYVEIADHKAFS